MMNLETATFYIERRQHYIREMSTFHPVIARLGMLDEERKLQRHQDSGCW